MNSTDVVAIAEPLATVLSEDEPVSSSEHLIALADEPWSVWRCVALRGAGFPATWVSRLAAVECAEAADRLLCAQENIEPARQATLDALQRYYAEISSEQRIKLINAMRRVRKGKIPELFNDNSVADKAMEELRNASQRCDSTTADFRRLFDEAAAHTSDAISHIAAHERFREALIWQNRQGFHNGVAPLVNASTVATVATAAERPKRTSKQRQREELVATYLQRYCVKNDTIGFFGPVSWATLVEQGAALRVSPGTEMLAARYVRFEGWAIDALAERLAEAREIKPWLAPRRVPFIHQQGLVLHLPGGQALKLGVRQAVVLQASDGQRSAKEIAAAVMRIEKLGIKSVEEVYAVLEELEQKELISWNLDVPLSLYPERALRKRLEQIENESLREPALSALNELEKARDAVAQAAGDSGKLDEALSKLDVTFTRLTGAAATRSAGQTYAARTLVYEDCRRDIEVEIGPEIREALASPLSLLLTSARWFTFETATIYRQAFKDVYTELAQKTGSAIVEAVSFWQQVQPLVSGSGPLIVGALVSLFQEKWAQILNIPEDEHQLTYSSEQLREPVLAAFDAPRPGWRSACYHSPDVMIAAKSAEAISRGEYQLVMGELHLALNTLSASLRFSQHPAPEELIAALDADIPEPRLVPVNPKNWRGATARTLPALISAKDFRLIFTPEPHNVDKAQALPIGSLVVEETAAGLVLRTRDGLLQFDIVEAFGTALSSVVGNLFHIMRRAAHSPRVTIDQLIVCRETWRFSPSALAFAFERDEATRFLAARRFARAHGLPRFVFVKVPVEIKPFYVDLASPVLVNVLAKMVRRTAEQEAESEGQSSSLMVSVSEMMPRGDESWLEDAGGERYTSELRIVAVDPLK